MPFLQSQVGVRLSSSLSQPPVTFEPQPNLGGLGVGALHQNWRGQQMYYQNMVGLLAGQAYIPLSDIIRSSRAKACTPQLAFKPNWVSPHLTKSP